MDSDPDCLLTDSSEGNPNDRLRTDLRNNKDKTTLSDMSSKSSSVNSLLTGKYNVKECQVVLNDFLSSGSIVKSKMLNGNPDNPHSVPSHRPADRSYLEKLAKKDPIAWPKMSDEEKWTNFDNIVAGSLCGASTIFNRLSLLVNTIYQQASLLFGIKEKSKKNLKGLNRRAQHSIALIKEKKTLKSQLNSAFDKATKASLQPLLEEVKIIEKNGGKLNRPTNHFLEIHLMQVKMFSTPTAILF